MYNIIQTPKASEYVRNGKFPWEVGSGKLGTPPAWLFVIKGATVATVPATTLWVSLLVHDSHRPRETVEWSPIQPAPYTNRGPGARGID